MEEIKTLQEAMELLDEARNFINESEDELYGKAEEGTMSKLETAYIEIDEVIGYLQKLNKEKK